MPLLPRLFRSPLRRLPLLTPMRAPWLWRSSRPHGKAGLRTALARWQPSIASSEAPRRPSTSTPTAALSRTPLPKPWRRT
eukprot:8617047-Alexandrium_andersonii.AAC.1